MKAMIVIDMLNDFVTGVFGCYDAQRIVSNIIESLKIARSKEIPIIYLCTNLLNSKMLSEEGDKLIKIWGVHAMKGTKGAEIVPQLKPDKNDTIIYKKLYSGFENGMLNSFLKDHKIDTLIFTGLYTDICILNNVVYAFHLGYDTTIVRDCTIATDQDQEFDYQYMKDLYNTKIIDKDDLELYIGED